jgi:hypothetical protein
MRLFILLCLFITPFFTRPASAAAETALNTSVTGASDGGSGFLDHPSRFMMATLRTEIYGPGVTLGGNGSRRPDLNTGVGTNPKDLIRAEHKFVAAYKWSPSVLTGVGLEANQVATAGFIARDPYLVLRDNQLLHTDFINWDLQGRAYAGLTDNSVKAHSPFAFRLSQTWGFRPSRGRWTLDVHGYAHLWTYGADASAQAQDFRAHFNPYVTYRISPKIAARADYRAYGNHKRNRAWNDLDSEPTTAGPGVIWDVTPAFNVNPFLDLSPGTGFKWSHSTVGVNLNWRAI